MATKTRRFEARTDDETMAVLEQAASISRIPVSTFVLDSAREAAEKVVARSESTLMPGEQFDRMLAALDTEPEVLPALQEAADRPRRFRRR